MAKKKRLILVGEDGGTEPRVEVSSNKIQKIKWLPNVEGEDITITFQQDIPFENWPSKTDTDDELIGTLKKSPKGTYKYSATGWRRRKGRGDAVLIVDGGRSRTETARKSRRKART